MKRLLAAISGALLTVSLSASPVLANDDDHHNMNANVRYWPAGHAIVVNDPDAPDGRRVLMVAEPGAEFPRGGRAIYVSDDPRYDLSGSGDVLYLVEDGSTVKARAGRGVAVYAGTNAVPRDRVSIPAEYRQDWLAVAAGDRPVRVVSPGTASTDMSQMAYVPVRVFYSDAGREYGHYRGNGMNGARYTANGGKRHYKRSAVTTRRHRPAARVTTASRVTHRKHHATVASARPYRRARTSAYAPASYASYRPAVTTRSDYSFAETRVAAQPDLYQVGNSWYREENGSWSRGYSWKGPFVPVHKGRVPREVIQSSKRND